MADQVIEIAPDGDVVLVVTNAEHTLQFKVHSIFLRSASKVFASMLSPNFAEGQALAVAASSSSPCEINLNGDDPECMMLILNIIHFQHDKSPQRLTSKEVVNLTALVDKYLLHSAMPFASSNWFIPTKDDDLHAFLQAAILLGHAESFTKTTRLMILHQPTSYSPQACAGKDGIFFHAIIKVEKKRDDIRRKMMSVFNPMNVYSESIHECEYTRQIVRQLYKNLDSNGLGSTKLQGLGLEHGFDMMLRMFNIDTAPRSSDICGSKHPHTTASYMKQAYESKLKELVKFGGLCLDCEQEEYKGVQEGVCRFAHKFCA